MNAPALRWLVIAALFSAAPHTLRAQAPAAAPANAPKTTASIRGRVTAAETGVGLRRAQVSISGGDLPQRRTASTNARGDFELRDLPPGRYTVSVTRSGYLPFEYGQRRLGERGKALDLAGGEAMTSVDVAMPRASVISGRVIDENSEPVPAVSIWIMRQEFFRGRRRLVPVTVGVRTDDTGQYRATGLGSGEYVVFATLRETWVAGGEKKLVLGYAPTYFPGTAAIEQAQHVKVAAGKETPNVDIALIAAPAVVVSGTARRADGAPLAGASVGLSQATIGPTSSSFGSISSASVDADGSWRLRDIPPGEYELEASAVDRTRGSETAWMKLVVQGTDIDGVSLIAEGPVKLTGEVTSESGAPLPAAAGGRLRITVETNGDRRQNPSPAGDENGVVKSDGTFTLTTFAGLSIVRVGPLPRGWAIKSVAIGEREVADGAIELKSGEDVEGARIVVTDRFPAVSGRITDDRAAAAEGTVVLFPADDSRWLTAGAAIRSTRTDQNGIFRLETVPPGDYFVVALDAVQTWEANDPEFLAELKNRAERVTVREGMSPQLNLRLKK